MSISHDSVSTSVPIIAVLREDGTIVRVNAAWEAFGARNGQSDDYQAVGANYLTIARQADDDHGARVATGLQELLTGDGISFTTVYPCHGPDEERWFRLNATPVVDEPLVLAVHHRVTDPDGGPIERVGSPAVSSQPGQDSSQLVTKTLGPDEPASMGVIDAFDALGVDVFSRTTTLHDWVDTDAIDTLSRECSEFELRVSVWDYPVAITPDRVTVYSPESDP